MPDNKEMDVFEERITFRVFYPVIEEARENVAANQDQYENLSHYIRSGVIALNVRHREGLPNSLQEAVKYFIDGKEDVTSAEVEAFKAGWQLAKGVE